VRTYNDGGPGVRNQAYLTTPLVNHSVTLPLEIYDTINLDRWLNHTVAFYWASAEALGILSWCGSSWHTRERKTSLLSKEWNSCKRGDATILGTEYNVNSALKGLDKTTVRFNKECGGILLSWCGSSLHIRGRKTSFPSKDWKNCKRGHASILGTDYNVNSALEGLDKTTVPFNKECGFQGHQN